MKGMIIVLCTLVLVGGSLVLGADNTTSSRVQPQVIPAKTTTDTPGAKVQTPVRPGVRYVDANNDGICDNRDNRAPRGQMKRQGAQKDANPGMGRGQGGRRGSCRAAGRGQGRGGAMGKQGRGGRGQQLRKRDGSCVTPPPVK